MVASRRDLGAAGRWGSALVPAGVMVPAGVLVPAGLFSLALLMLFVLPDDESHRSPDPLAVLLIGVMTVVLVFRHRWPVAVLATTVAAVASYQLLDYLPEPALPPVLVALYTVASTGRRRRSLVVGALTSALVVATFVIAEPQLHLSDVLGAVGWVLVAVAVGEAVRYHRAYTAEVEARMARVAADRETQAQQRVARERIRIARDVHDVVAHSIAAINVQAGVGAHLIAQAPRPDAATLQAVSDILHNIAETSRTGVADLHATLELLRGDEAPQDSPVCGLDGVPALVAPVRSGGTEVTVEALGEPRPLPQAQDVAAFRIIQEALTNAVKHGRPDRIDITVRYDPAAVYVTVTDHLPAAVTAPEPGRAAPGGYGMLGMTERAHSVGGWLSASARPDGGFTVEAMLPVPRAPDPPAAARERP